MKTGILDRSWLSPLTGLVFLVTATTGLMLFFHVRGAFLFTLHQWMGILFIFIGILHVACNWKSLKTHFRGKSVFIPLVVVSGVSVVILFFANGHYSDNGRDRAGYRHGYTPDAEHHDWKGRGQARHFRGGRRWR